MIFNSLHDVITQMNEIFVGMSLSASKKQMIPYTSGSVHDSMQTLIYSVTVVFLSNHTLTIHCMVWYMVTKILEEYSASTSGGKLHSTVFQKTAILILNAIRTPNLQQ
jgi:hypothetical protein